MVISLVHTVGLREWTLSASNGWHSDALHTIERLRHIDATTVSYEITIDDPKIFTRVADIRNETLSDLVAAGTSLRRK